MELNPEGIADRTTVGVFFGQAARLHDRPLVHYIAGDRWRVHTWSEMKRDVLAVASSLVDAGVNQGDNVILMSCSDAAKVTGAINDAVDKGVPVMTFDSDAPQSKRFAFYGVDDLKTGHAVMAELATQMGDQGKVAVLCGNQNAPNLQKRVQGVKIAAKKYPGITIRDVYYHKETPQDAAAKVEQVMQANPDITGWAMVGGWPLFTDNALKWQPGAVKCVSVDALPPELAYLRSGHVQLLLAQQVYDWGYRSVEHLINKIHFKKDPPSPKDISALIPVTRANVDDFAKNWEKWLPK